MDCSMGLAAMRRRLRQRWLRQADWTEWDMAAERQAAEVR
jgi:hypothetical protein